MYLLLTLVLNTLALIITTKLVPGFRIDDYMSALLAAIVLGVANTFIKPILSFLTAPLTIITLGLFAFVVNAVMLWITDALVPGLTIENWFSAILAAIVLSVVSTVLSMVTSDVINVGGKKKK